MTHDPGNEKLSKPDYGKRDYAAAGLLAAANPRLGARDGNIADAYPTSPILKNTYTLSDAADLLAEIPTGDAGNGDFPKYSRNFTPVAPADDELYGKVRSKAFTPLEGSGLGSAYSPTVVSPGASEGFSPLNLAVVRGVVPIKAEVENPANIHNNANTDLVGTVRRFTLGQGSNTVRVPA